MVSFEVGQIQINLAGEQVFTIETHAVTREDGLKNMIVVTAGGLLIYVYDRAAASAFATAARTACRYIPAGLGTHAGLDASSEDPNRAPGILLRVAGAPAINRVHGLGAAYGTPRVRIQLDYLTVNLFDRSALTSWQQGWAGVEELAESLWPEPDTFEASEARARRRIARTGRVPGRPAE